MTTRLEDSLIEQFTKLEIAPRKHTRNLAHLHADFAEIIALLKNEDLFSSTDLVNRYKSYNITITDLNVYNDEDDEDGEEEEQPSQSEINDAYVNWSHEVFSILLDRKNIYGQDYPFAVDATSIRLVDSEEVVAKKRIYIILLLCANLNHFKTIQPILTSEFEYLSYIALKEFMSSDAQVKQFGKNSDYTGSAQKKITDLAKDMMGLEINEIEFDKVLGNQEKGLDVVGWYPFKDNYSNFLSIFAQCACGKKWYTKLNETRKYHNYYRFEKLNPIHALFVPGALFSKAVQPKGDFFQSDELVDVLLFERLRILECIQNTDFLDTLKSNEVVDAAIKYEEGLV